MSTHWIDSWNRAPLRRIAAERVLQAPGVFISASEPRRSLVGDLVVEVEDDSLALAQHPEDRAIECVDGEIEHRREWCR